MVLYNYIKNKPNSACFFAIIGTFNVKPKILKVSRLFYFFANRTKDYRTIVGNCKSSISAWSP